MSSRVALAIEDLTVVFALTGVGGLRPRELVALDGIRLRIDRGERLALVGASGSGKTTLARVMSRLQRPTAGTVTLWPHDDLPGFDVWRAPRRRLAGRIQMVFQDPYGSLDPRRTVFDTVVDGRRGWRRRAADEDAVRVEVAAALAEVGLPSDAGFVAGRPHQLSGGQRQRLSLARALFGAPEVLLADEPTSMLDAPLRRELLELLRERSIARGLTTVLITHDLAAAQLFSDRTVVLHDGQICEQGPTELVLAEPKHPQTQRMLAAQARWPIPSE